MRHGLDFVDLQNPKVRRPTVRLKQRIMIGTEMSRCTPTMNGGVEHATEAGAIDGPAMHAETDDATNRSTRFARSEFQRDTALYTPPRP